MNGRGSVEPNPMVACVLVKNGHVIGEGYHAKFGGPHAEPTALANCTESPAGGTAYVTLEPCCHTNKKTPPCAPQLIEAKVARVVIGCLDPNPDVNGKGVAMLRDVLRALRPGGRALVVGAATRGGFGAVFTRVQSGPGFDAVAALKAEGFTPVRRLAERDGLTYAEGIKPRQPS